MERIETLEEVIQEGKERLHPPLTNPSWLVLRKRREIFQHWLVKLHAGEMDVLDLGGRIQPYRPLFAPNLRRYVAVDLRLSPLVEVVARAEALPIADRQFDLVICTQVLQYVAQPALVISEVWRVLKQGGYFVFSVPSACATDSENECWRFLPAGLRALLGSFREVEIIPEGGSVAGFFRTSNVCMNIFVRYPIVRAVFRRTVCPFINLLGAFLERLSGSRNEQFAVNYSGIARK